MARSPDRMPPPPATVIRALLNPALDDIWLHLFQPLPEERDAPREENAAAGDPSARGEAA